MKNYGFPAQGAQRIRGEGPTRPQEARSQPVRRESILRGDGLRVQVRRIKGASARLGPRFSLLISGILLSLPNCAWASGNKAEWAKQLGSIGGTTNFLPTKDCLRRADAPYKIEFHLVFTSACSFLPGQVEIAQMEFISGIILQTADLQTNDLANFTNANPRLLEECANPAFVLQVDAPHAIPDGAALQPAVQRDGRVQPAADAASAVPRRHEEIRISPSTCQYIDISSLAAAVRAAGSKGRLPKFPLKCP